MRPSVRYRLFDTFAAKTFVTLTFDLKSHVLRMVCLILHQLRIACGQFDLYAKVDDLNLVALVTL